MTNSIRARLAVYSALLTAVFLTLLVCYQGHVIALQHRVIRLLWSLR